LKQHKTWFDEECLPRNRAKMQRVQNSTQSSVDNLNSVSREACRYFRNNKKEYLNAKIEELETNSKIKNIKDLYTGISDFKVYQPGTNLI
jgi:SLT domain-containing protein